MDLENFPTSPAAKRMLSYVSTGFYDESYVGKWIYQVLGTQVDTIADVVDQLPYQAFVETATWGLSYWETLVGLPVREDLSYEERRARVNARLDNRHPDNPAWISQYLSGITGREVTVTEHQRTYTFSVRIGPGEGSYNLLSMIKRLDAVKPAHLSYDIVMVIEAEIPLRVGAALHLSHDHRPISEVEDPLVELLYAEIYRTTIRPSDAEIQALTGQGS